MWKNKFAALTATLLVSSLAAGLVPAQTASAGSNGGTLVPYFNASLPVEARVADLLGRMTLDEKIGQMVQAERASVTPEDVQTYKLGSVLSGGGSFPNGKQSDSTRGQWASLVDSYQAGALSTRLGIPILYGVDAMHGNSNLIGATLFPHNIGLGATRDPALVEQIGTATAQEIKAAGTNWAFAPMIADPQNINWGRTYEGFGDNQSLVAQMGVSFLKGLQGDTIDKLKKTERVVATVKHYLGEGLTEGGVNQGNVTGMSEDEVVALDLPIYKAAVDAGARTLMASYSSIQGLKMHANKHLLTDVLKGTGEGQLGFTGFVVSDYNAVQQITKDQDGKAVSGLKDQIRVSVNAGVDMLMMPSDWRSTLTALKDLAASGDITQARIDDAVTRILRVKFESGTFEHPMTDSSLASSFGSADHRALARQAVSESLVLLKNDKVGDSPILSQLSGMSKIFVAGKSANDIGLQAGGWSVTWQGAAGNTTPGTTILKGIQQAVGNTKTVTYNKNGRGAVGNDVAIVFVGETPYAESAGDELNKLMLNMEDQATLDNVKASGVPTIVVLVSGRPMMIGDRLGDWAGLVEAWLPGTEGEGIADVLFGASDFTGKLPVRWPFYTEAYKNPAAGQSNLDSQYILFDYGHGLTKAQQTPALPPMPPKPGPSAPYTKVEAENYAAKSDGLKSENTSDAGGGQDIGYTSKDAWLEYWINVPTAGSYDIDFRYAGGDASITNSGMLIQDAGGNTLGELKGVGYTGGWQTWQTASVTQVPFTAGVQKIRLKFTDGGLNFNWFGSTGFNPAATPGEDNGGTVGTQDPVEGGAGAVESWLSSERNSQSMNWYYAPQWQPGDEAKQLTPQPGLDLTDVGSDPGVTTIQINPSKTYQSMMGMGSSMEESTVFNITKMSEEKQNELLTKLASPADGIGISMTRLTIGTADFTSRAFYTYDDLPAGQTDPNLEHFSIQKDIDYGIIPVLQKMIKINPDMTFFASPWSPPGWMKTTDSMIRGSVKDEYLPVLADYYVKYIEAYKEQGIPISAMTLQNEPLLEIDYPSTKMPWQQEAELAKILHQKLVAAGLDVKIWVFDHNFSDTMTYPALMLADSANRDAIDGTAFHDYSGDPSSMSQLHDLYPDENIYLTERAVWGTAGADRIALYFRNWAKSYNSWVVMLDSDIATHQWVGTPDPTMLIQDSSNPDNYWLTPEYYMLGNYSKFVRPGYTRIDSSYGSKDKVTNVSFISPDQQTIVSIVVNQTDKEQTFKLLSDGTQIAAAIPAKSVVTYKWNRIIKEQETPVVFTVQPQSLPYNVDHKELTLQLSGGTFDNPNDIGLGAQAAELGISKGQVTLVSPTEAKLELLWDSSKSYYANTPLSVTLATYTDKAGQPLSGTVMLAGTGRQTEAVDISASPVTADVYNQLSGVAMSGTGPNNGRLNGFNAGDWASFKIKVPAAGQYAVTLKVASPNGGGFLLQSEDGNTLGSYVIPNLYGSTSWAGARLTVQLPAGEQIIRVQGSNGEFDLKEIGFEPLVAQQLGSDGTIKVEAESFVAAGQQVIQYGDSMNNLGYTVGGSTFDYLLNVPKEGYYKLKLSYATPQGGVSALIQSSGMAKGSIPLPSTGGWGTYKEASGVVQLDAGIQTLRIVDNGDGFNFDWFTLEPGSPVVVVKKATPPVAIAAAGSNGAKLLTLSTTIDDAVIHYTTDGSLPTKDSEVYTGPISVTSAQVIRAITTKDGMSDSFVTFFAAPDAVSVVVPVQGITIDPAELNLTVGQVGTLKVKFQPEVVSNEEVTWTSSDSSIATVDSSGKVTAVAPGSARIKAVSVVGGKEASAVVTVTEAGGGSTPTPAPTAIPTPAPSTESTPPPTTPAPGTGIVTIEVTADANGNAAATVKADDLRLALKGASNHKVVIVVKPSSGTKQVKVDIPVLAASDYSGVQAIEINTGFATVTINPTLLTRNGGTEPSSIQLSIELVSTAALGSAIHGQLNGSAVYDFNLSLNGTRLSSFTGHDVRVAIPYTLKSGEKQGNIIIYSIEENGSLKVVKNGKYNPATGKVEFDASHFSKYAAAYADVAFQDTAKVQWAEDAISALAARGAIKGTGNGKFNPNGEVTRAEFVKMLIETFDLTNQAATATFSDVKQDAWFASAIQSAQSLGIVNGKKDGTFGVNDRITREEMAVMVYRLGQHMNLAFTSSGNVAAFTDQAQVSAYAKAAVEAMRSSGIITGMTNGSFSPKENASRAQAASIIYRLFNQA